MAGYNARSCVIGTDKCHSTQKFPQSGQNVGAVSGVDNIMDFKILITGWFRQHVNGSMTIMNHNVYFKTSDHVGCALVNFHKKNVLTKYLVCNYGNMLRVDRRAFSIFRRSRYQCKQRSIGLNFDFCWWDTLTRKLIIKSNGSDKYNKSIFSYCIFFCSITIVGTTDLFSSD